MNDDEVLCEIKWTVADVKSAFREEYDREPTEKELEECVSCVDTKALEEWSIERGWTFITDAIEEAMPVDEED